MTTLPDIRDRVRSDLRDLDPDAARWSEAELDRHISRALADVSLAAPAEATTVVTTTPGSREVTTAVLPNFLDLESVELPIDTFPRRLVPFSVWAGTITLEPPAPRRASARGCATSPGTRSTTRARPCRKRSRTCSPRAPPDTPQSPGPPTRSTG